MNCFPAKSTEKHATEIKSPSYQFLSQKFTSEFSRKWIEFLL